jgi:putative Holliday junction resolvase
LTAQGLTTIRFEENSFKQAMRLLKETLAKFEIEVFVLGNPKHMNGDEGDSSQRSIDFKKRLENNFNKVEVILWDERLSTVMANNYMIDMNMSKKQRKQVIDEKAAINILQGYLDSKKCL